MNSTQSELDIQELMNRGMAYMAAENYKPAAESFQSIIKADGSNIEAYVQLGNAFACLGRHSDALRAFKTALMYKENDGKILCSIGGVYLLMDRVADAVRYYNRAEAAGYRSVDMYIILSGVFEENEDYPQAIRYISAALTLKPLYAELYSRKANLQMRCGKSDEAMDTLDELESLIPDSYNVYDQKVKIFCMQEDFASAEKVVEEVLKRFPKDPAIMLLRLNILIGAERYEEAVSYAETISPNDQEKGLVRQLLLCRTTALAMLGRSKEVIKALEEYKYLNTDAQALYLLMNTYLAEKDFENVKRIAAQLETVSTDAGLKASAMYYQANAIQHIGESEEANAEYKRIIPILRHMSIATPRQREIYVYRLLAYTELNEYEKALDLCEYLEKAYPELPDGHMYKAHVYKCMGRKEDAEKELEIVNKIAPGVIAAAD